MEELVFIPASFPDRLNQSTTQMVGLPKNQRANWGGVRRLEHLTKNLYLARAGLFG
jgi:hypothetical protein